MCQLLQRQSYPPVPFSFVVEGWGRIRTNTPQRTATRFISPEFPGWDLNPTLPPSGPGTREGWTCPPVCVGYSPTHLLHFGYENPAEAVITYHPRNWSGCVGYPQTKRNPPHRTCYEQPHRPALLTGTVLAGEGIQGRLVSPNHTSCGVVPIDIVGVVTAVLVPGESLGSNPIGRG